MFLSSRPVFPCALVAALTVVTAGCEVSLGGPGDVCTLEPCEIDDGEEPVGANVLCDLQVECASFICLSYRADGNPDRRPFCTDPCTPAPGCDGLNPASCPDPGAGCPNRWVCQAVAEVVGPEEPGNCTVTVGDVERASRCACVPCCDVDPASCPDPASCDG